MRRDVAALFQSASVPLSDRGPISSLICLPGPFVAISRRDRLLHTSALLQGLMPRRQPCLRSRENRQSRRVLRAPNRVRMMNTATELRTSQRGTALPCGKVLGCGIECSVLLEILASEVRMFQFLVCC